VDVFAVKRRHEGVVEPLNHVVDDPVALVLAIVDDLGELATVRVAREHLLEKGCRADDVRAGPHEQVKVFALVGSDDLGKARHGASSAIGQRRGSAAAPASCKQTVKAP